MPSFAERSCTTALLVSSMAKEVCFDVQSTRRATDPRRPVVSVRSRHSPRDGSVRSGRGAQEFNLEQGIEMSRPPRNPLRARLRVRILEIWEDAVEHLKVVGAILLITIGPYIIWEVWRNAFPDTPEQDYVRCLYTERLIRDREPHRAEGHDCSEEAEAYVRAWFERCEAIGYWCDDCREACMGHAQHAEPPEKAWLGL